ncbi:hypothetical protein V491_05439 [Pseudogymnoascus sp. VKM F-3775]|nr:hypothetical protein V491_05439 [Pseudogymnoascus sp. VKM F-3775]
MRNLRPRPSRQIEEFFIPTERKSSLRSQTYPSAKTATKTSPSVLCADPNTMKYLKQSPPRKRDKVVGIDSDESEPEIKPSPTKRPKANKARPSYPSPPSDEDTVMIETMSGTVLLDLPPEIHQSIIDYLSSDKDANHYGATCKALRACLAPIVWQKRFLREFDTIPGADPVKLQFQYKKRQGIAKRHISFEDNELLDRQKYCLDMIREMIIESNAHVVQDEDNNEIVSGLNHNFFVKYFQYIAPDGRLKGTDLMNNIAGTEFMSPVKRRPSGPKPLAKLIRLCFVHLLLHPHMCNIKTNIFLASQENVYKCFTEAPLFLGKNKYEINTPWLLHAANFFKFHFKTPDGEGILAHMYQQLEKGELPRAWMGRLKNGTQKLGPHWKGAFTFLHDDELELFRLGQLYDNVIDETTDGNNGFQDLTLFSDLKRAPQLVCPPEMEEWLKANPRGEYTDKVSGKKVMPKVQDFFGLGRSEVDYHLHGRMHGLPLQEGIPGFQRVSMLKYLPCVDGTYGTGRTSFWAYEGCVLPGNQIMLGRWWSPTGSMDRGRTYCGPFIFWRVSGSAEDKMRTTDDALAFLDRVEKKTIG